MDDVTLLAQQAVTVLAPLLPVMAASVANRVADGFFRQPGAKLYDWLAAKVKGGPAETALARAVDEPENSRRLDVLRLEIEELIEKDPVFRAELAALVGAARAEGGVTQNAEVSGDGAKVAQVSGSGNDVRIG